MRLLTLLSLRDRGLLDRVAGIRAATSCHARTFPELARALESEPWSTVVLDPAVLTDENFDHIGAVVSQLKCGLLLYGSLSPGCTRFLVTWSDRLIVDMYFPDRESDGALLSLKLLAMQSQTACGRLLNAVAPHIGLLPHRIRDGLVGLFGTLPIPPSAEHFSRSISVPRKTLDRWMIRTGFVSGVAIVKAIRLAWAWDLTRAEGAGSPAHIASRCGYASEHALWSHAQRTLLIVPSALRDAPPTGALLTRLCTSALR